MGFTMQRNTRRNRASFRPNLEILESRIAPVIGGRTLPPVLEAGIEYNGINVDGTVRFNGVKIGSGSIVDTRIGTAGNGAILTAAHVPDDTNRITFFLRRDAGSPTREIVFPFAETDVYAHPNRDLDLAIVRLEDANDHLYVAPFGAPRYSFVNSKIDGPSNAADRDFTVVGFGKSGTGDGKNQMPPGKRTGGVNTLDVATSGHYRYDFDSGLAIHNTIRNANNKLSFLGIPGKDKNGQPLRDAMGNLLVIDASPAGGDSGAPIFVDDRIVAVHTDSNTEDLKYGRIGMAGRVDNHISHPRLQEGLGYDAAGKVLSYDLVLDMNKQLLGVDRVREALTITVERVGANLQIGVSSKAGSFNGIYYSAPAEKINSLKLIGSDDDETFIIRGPLWTEAPTGRPISIDGGKGNDVFEADVTFGNFLNGIEFDGGVGDNTVRVRGGSNFVLEDTGLKVDAGDLALSSVKNAQLFGRLGNNRFEISDWNGFSVLDGSLGDTDQVVFARDANFRVASDELRVDASFAVMKGIELLSLSSGPSANVFDIDWSGELAIDGGAGTDRLSVAGGSQKLQLTSIEEMSVSAGEANLSNNVAISKVSLAGGKLTSAGELSIGDIFQWTNGEVSGNPQQSTRIIIEPSAVFDMIMAGTGSRMKLVELKNQGAIEWRESSNYGIFEDSSLENFGTMRLTNRVGASVNGSLTIYNRPTGFLTAANSGKNYSTLALDGAIVRNEGKFELSGNTSFSCTDFIQLGGSTNIGKDAHFAAVNQIKLDGGDFQSE